MDNPSFLLLGLLKGQSRHGYEINEFIERNLSRFVSLKKATAYSLLDRLQAKGLVAEHTEQIGKRPPRKVYSLTPAGEEEFARLLAESLRSAASPEFYGDLGLIFLGHIGREEAVALLRERRAELEAGVTALRRVPKHDGVIGAGLHGVDLAVGRQAALMEADLAWLDAALVRLEAET